MKKYLLIVLLIGPILIMGQVTFEKVSDPFVMDTKDPDISLNNPIGGETYFINDSIDVLWNATDNSFGAGPVSIGIRIQQTGPFTLLKESIQNLGATYVPSGPDMTEFGKINLIVSDIYGNTSEDSSTTFFDLVEGYSMLTINPSTGNFGAISRDMITDTSLYVWLRNNGNKDLEINNLGGLSLPFDFSFTTPGTILPGDSLELEISLDRSTVAGVYEDVLVLDTASKSTNLLPVSATLYNSWPSVSCGPDITKCAVSTIPVNTTVTGGVPPYNYSWNNGSTFASISTSTLVDSMFIVTVTDQLGLQDTDTIWVLIQQVYEDEEVCIVTVDSASQKNIVVWEKTPGVGTKYYNVYKQSSPTPLAAVSYDSLSVYIDLTTNPQTTAESYMITAVDSCENESALSDYHRTILLTTNVGSPGINLIWNVYEGFEYDWFYIYRGASLYSMTLIDSVFHANELPHSYPDLNPPPLDFTYRISVVKHPDSICSPTVGKDASGPFKKSLSNIGDNYFLNYQFQLNVLLEGPYEEGIMSTSLYQNQLIPRFQPFNKPPWNYSGEEVVNDIPNPNIVDWILFELRKTSGGPNTAYPDSVLVQRAGFLLNTGSVVDLDGASNIGIEGIFPADNFNLYAVIILRNHLSIMSGYPVLKSGGALYYHDFTDAPYKSFYIYPNLAQKLINDKWVMIAGDANSDGLINEYDKSDSLWVEMTGYRGYHNFDLNQDGEVNNIDKNDFWLPNLDEGTQVPE